MPRLDKMLAKGAQPRRQPGEKLLVMTAKKPWFDEAQREVTLRSLRELKEHLDSQPQIEVVWRLTKDVASILGVENRLGELSTRELAEVLYEVDGVVTTVSTTILESMLAGRPTAALDYHNAPRFVPTAWTISCGEQIEAALREALNPPANKMSFQEDCLRDVLRCDGAAAGHVAELMEKMAEIARQQREQGASLKLPPGLLGTSAAGQGEGGAALGRSTRGRRVFTEDDPVVLQGMLARPNAEIASLRQELETRRVGYWISDGWQVPVPENGPEDHQPVRILMLPGSYQSPSARFRIWQFVEPLQAHGAPSRCEGHLPRRGRGKARQKQQRSGGCTAGSDRSQEWPARCGSPRISSATTWS